MAVSSGTESRWKRATFGIVLLRLANLGDRFWGQGAAAWPERSVAQVVGVAGVLSESANSSM
jgi:hypothetical protein